MVKVQWSRRNSHAGHIIPVIYMREEFEGVTADIPSLKSDKDGFMRSWAATQSPDDRAFYAERTRKLDDITIELRVPSDCRGRRHPALNTSRPTHKNAAQKTSTSPYPKLLFDGMSCNSDHIR